MADLKDDIDEITPLLRPASSKPALRITTTPTIHAAAYRPSPPSPTFSKALIRKIDLRILPILLLTFALNFVDKTILANASVYGLSQDIDISGSRFALVSSIFYIGYFVFEYPATILIQSLPISTYLSSTILLWGLTLLATGFLSSYPDLLILRFIAGVLEASITPGFMFVTAMWYTRAEHASRMGVWFAGNSIGSMVGNSVSFGIGHIESQWRPWRWMYIIFGSTGALWGILVFLLLPNTISTSIFLTPLEKDVAETRTRPLNTTEDTTWNSSDAIQTLRNPQTWLLFLISLLAQIPNGGFQTFSNLVLTSFPFSPYASSLLPLPLTAASLLCIIIATTLATRHKGITTLFLIFLPIFPMIGNLLMLLYPNRFVKLGGFYTLSFSHAFAPLALSLISSNIRNVTQRMTMAALMLVAFCGGNIIGPMLFTDPPYHLAYMLIAVSYGLASICALALRFYLQAENKNLEREDAPGTPVLRVVGQTEEVVVVGKGDGWRNRL